MLGFGRDSRVPEFPIEIIRAAVAIKLVALCAAAYFTYQIADTRRAIMGDQLDVLTAAERMEHYGVILELSVRAAASGDPEGAGHYRAVQPELRATVDELRGDLHFEEDRVTAGQIEQADLTLVALEQEALELARNGNFDEAQDVLNSPEYDRLVDIYTS